MFWLNNSSWHLKKQGIFGMLSLPHRRIPKMQCNITTSLIVSLSENGFGLDELIYRMEQNVGGSNPLAPTIFYPIFTQ